MYAIHATYSFYSGTFNAPSDGIIAAYATREDRDKVLASLTGEGSRYYLRHGEYAAPTYKAMGCNRAAAANVSDRSSELLADTALDITAE